MHSTLRFHQALSILLSLGATALPALAQDAGGVRLAPGLNGGPVGLARPMAFTRPPLLTARDVQNGMTAADHQAQNQGMITAQRGDPGFLTGFAFGSPLAASRQPVLTSGGDGGGHGHQRRQPIIINNNGPLAVTVGNDNLVQQQSSTGSGPTAQQQVANVGGRGTGGGALNLVSGGGNIVQRAPN